METTEHYDFQPLPQSTEQGRPLQVATPPLINDRFQIISEIGRGGMAEVHLAEDLHTGNRVALKTMSRRLAGTAKQRFTREFSTIASLKHPYLIEVFEYGESDDGPFFAMEFFDSKPATAMINAPLDQILKAVFHLCEAVDFIHSKRIVHRDIKPGNILVRRTPDRDGFDLRLSDFGLAKFANTSSSLSRETNFLGTLAYCAPEQILREDLDHRADLYAIGMVCHQLLAGEHPFESAKGNIQALISKQLSEQPIELRAIRNDIPEEFSREVLKLLAKDANDRPKSTVDLRRIIADCLGWSDSVSQANVQELSGQLSTRFVGRVDELSKVEKIVASALKPKLFNDTSAEICPMTVFLTGDAGMGKTSLIRKGARKALVAGGKVFEGRCFEGNITPFQPFVQIIRQILSERERVKRRARKAAAIDRFASTTMLHGADSSTAVDNIVREYASELIRLGPELHSLLAERAPSRITEVQKDPSYVFRVIANFFVSIAKTQPICLLLEDIHWADKSTVELYRHIATELELASRQSASSETMPRMAICLTSRSEDAYADSISLIDSMAKSPIAKRIHLQPVQSGEIAELIGSVLHASVTTISKSIIDLVTDNCFGNPFHVIQTVRELRDRNQIRCDNGQWHAQGLDLKSSDLLTSIRDAVEQRLSTLDAETKRLNAMASVIGNVVDLELLRQLAGGLDEFHFYDAIDELLAKGVMRELPERQCLQFSHELFRESSLQSLSHTRFVRINRHIAEILEGQIAGGTTVDRAVLANHHLQAGDKANAYRNFFLAAEQAVETQAYSDACKILSVATSNLPNDLSRQQRFELEHLFGLALNHSPQYREAVAHFECALQHASTRLERARALAGIARNFPNSATPAEALPAYEKSLAEISEQLPASLIARLFKINFNLAKSLVLPSIFARANDDMKREKTFAIKLMTEASMLYLDTDITSYLCVSARRAWIARQSGNPEAIKPAFAKLAVNFASSGYPASLIGRHCLKVAESQAEHDISPYTKAYLDVHIGVYWYLVGELEKGKEKILESRNLLGNTRDLYHIIAVHMRRHIASLQGDAYEILAVAEEELEAAEKISQRIACSWANYGIADAYSRIGRIDEAIRLVDKSVQDTRGYPTNNIALAEQSRVYLQASRYEEAAEIAERASRQLLRDWMIVEWPLHCHSLKLEAIAGPRWSLGPGELSTKNKSKLGKSGRIARFWGASFVNLRAHALRASGRAAAASGKTAKARRYFEKAVRCAQHFGNRGEEARSLVDMSCLLDGAESRERRQSALSMLEELSTVLPEAERDVLNL